MPFKNENASSKLPPAGRFQVGRSDLDNDAIIESGIDIPWASDPAGSYVYYDCTIGVMLDSGVVVHNRLPQVDNTADSLSSTTLDSSNLDRLTDRGVNLQSNDRFTDIVQRMGHSRYWFRIWGQALRIGYRIPIPGIRTIGGVPAIPHDNNPQWATNSIVPGGNYGGIPLWRAMWSLWYTVVVPPTANTIPAADPSAHITGDRRLPAGVQSPWSPADDNTIVGGGPVGNINIKTQTD